MLTEHAAVPLDIHGGLIDKNKNLNPAILMKFSDLYTFTRRPYYNKYLIVGFFLIFKVYLMPFN